MAPLRSSRHTRHTDAHTASTRAGRNANDFDPTDGLPVRKFILETVSVNQDAAIEATDPHAAALKTTKDGFPWEEHPLPAFFDQLPAHNQDLLRRSRAGERETKCSVWDKKASEWVRYEEARKRGLTGDIGLRKSRYLAPTTNDDDEEAADVEDDDDDEGSDEDDAADANGTANDGLGGAVTPGLKKGKKRKQPPTQLLQDRTFEVKKWVQVPMDKADKMPEPKYLADRRPGMPNFYNQSAAGAWAQAVGYGAVLEGGGGHSYDLGDGSGLGTALGGGGGPGPNAGGMETPPVRKNMPPRPRKKKGGPGRKKKEVVEAERRAAEEARRRAEALERGEVEELKAEGEGESGGKVNELKTEEEDSGTPRSRKDDDDDSEGEGSEEGEVNEDGDRSGNATPTPTPGPTPLGAGTTATATSAGGLLNTPNIPSSLSREITGSAATDDVIMGTSSVAEPSLVESIPPSVDAQMTDVPPAQLDASAVPPPAVEPTVLETLSENPPPDVAAAATNAVDVASDPDAAPIASPLSVVDPVEFPPTGAVTAPETNEGGIENGTVNVPFDRSAESEVAPLTQGIEVGTAEQTDAEAAAAAASPTAVAEEISVGGNVGGDVKEAAAQGEVKDLIAVEERGGIGADDEGSHAVPDQQIADNPQSREEAEQGGGVASAKAGGSEGVNFDLLGGLEKSVADQENGST